jgi:hypothetical protein
LKFFFVAITARSLPIGFLTREGNIYHRKLEVGVGRNHVRPQGELIAKQLLLNWDKRLI